MPNVARIKKQGLFMAALNLQDFFINVMYLDLSGHMVTLSNKHFLK